ncbi:hypothetical protein MKZ38_004553 [Zalerion maritima]|uniref:Steroid 5-alpha reductase C-terminal domain-containing protein n=1 Tax=Zalerion maritima TaxID=339359 RepID=A0AAD5WQY9_9PEZI|nr:hypothetical protein MKZ38_004553 [Zalerion maritima]
MPVLSTLLPTAGLIFGIQAAFAVPACIYATERYYDLSGGLTFLAATGYAASLPARRAGLPLRAALKTLLTTGSAGALNWRHVAMGGMISIWSARLSSHLFSRIRKQGHDSRFDELKHSPPKFLVAWAFQALWVTVSLLPLTFLAAAPAHALPRLAATDVLGLTMWMAGMAFEVTADRQKTKWLEGKKKKEHDEEFMTTGLWQVCRYPNYLGEITLWTGAAIFASGMMARSSVLGSLGWGSSPWSRVAVAAMPFLCPAFSAFLLTQVSGIPLSQPKYDKKFGDREDYRKWRDSTPMLLPKFW